MKLSKMKLAIPILFLFMCYYMSFGEHKDTQMVTFHIKNECECPIWPATTPTAGYPVIGNGGFLLLPGHTKSIQAPSTWIGRIWARTGCNFTSTASLEDETSTACQTGDCNNQLSCQGAIGLPPATLIEVALQQGNDMPNYYGVTLVDGYNLAVSMSTMPKDSKCLIKGCKKSINKLCPKELQVLNQKEEVVACKSPCLAFKEDEFCCRNSYGTPETCKPNKYSELFKDACPSYFSYAYDTPSPLKNCSSMDYSIIFCPSKVNILQQTVSQMNVLNGKLGSYLF